MATTPQVLSHPRIRELVTQYGSSLSLPVLVPNLKGFQNLLSLLETTSVAPGSTIKLDPITNEIAVFVSASESFSKANLNCSIAQSLENLGPVMMEAERCGIRVRGYVSVVIGCPFEGAIKPSQVAGVVDQLRRMGCYEISLGDTIGVANTENWRVLLDEITKLTPVSMLAVRSFHFSKSFY